MGFIANAIKHIDQFGFSPTLTVNTFRSEVGSLCTVLALFFFGVYTFMTMNQYMFGQPVVMKEMVDIHSDASLLALVLPIVAVAEGTKVRPFGAGTEAVNGEHGVVVVFGRGWQASSTSASNAVHKQCQDMDGNPGFHYIVWYPKSDRLGWPAVSYIRGTRENAVYMQTLCLKDALPLTGCMIYDGYYSRPGLHPTPCIEIVDLCAF